MRMELIRPKAIAALKAVSELCLVTAVELAVDQDEATPPATEPLPPTTVTKVFLGKNETKGFLARASVPMGGKFDIGGFRVEIFQLGTVETKVPSFQRARVGLWPNHLIPVDTTVPGQDYWLDVTYLGVGEKEVEIQIGEGAMLHFVGIPTVEMGGLARFPFYAECQFAQIARAHGLADEGGTLAARVALAKQYHALMRAHRVEPMKHAITVYPDPTLKNLSWSDLVLPPTRIAAPVLWGPAPGNPPSAALLAATAAAQKAGTLPMDSIVYPWDEGQGTADGQALSACQTVKAGNPDLKVLTTREVSEVFKPYVDIFTPVVNYVNQAGRKAVKDYAGKVLFIYPSCMSNGNCQNQTDPAKVNPRTPFSCFVVETPDEPRQFIEYIQALGATGGLYFNFTQKLPTALTPGGLYNEGGNGDGTLLAPHPTLAVPLATLRLKALRQGLFDAEWRILGKQLGFTEVNVDAIREKVSQLREAA